MNENIDLTKILKDCPKGWKFWSPLFGEVKFYRILYSIIEIECVSLHRIVELNLTGKYLIEVSENNGTCFSSECLLFPSKDQRDWSKFTAPWYKKEKFDPKTFQPFDKVIVRNYSSSVWNVDFYSCKYANSEYSYGCVGDSYIYCIPYNNETKHLVGTIDEVPEFYKYWEY